MDTRPVRFEFQCEEGADELKFIHNIPSGLVNPEALAVKGGDCFGAPFC